MIKPRASDTIREKLLSVNDWRIREGSQIRMEYDRSKRSNKSQKPAVTEVLPFGTNDDLDFISKPKPQPKSSRMTMTRFSRVFTKGTGSKKAASIYTAPEKPRINKKDERIQLQELVFDKQYINRVLWDEHVRMLFLRSGKLNQLVLKQRPYLRLWMEAMMCRISENSRKLRHILRQELQFISGRYQVQRQLHFWQTLHSLTLDQLYHRRRQHAFQRRIRYDSVSEQLDLFWRWFAKGDYKKVEKSTGQLIKSVTSWREKSPTSVKFKLLADLNYVRGLALMHLEKYDSAFKCFRKDGEIGEFANLVICVERTQDNVARIQAIKGNYKQAIKMWTERSETMTELIEKAWVYYNLALCYALDEFYEKAMEMVNNCLHNAEKAKSYVWELNGHLLLANISAMLGMLREASVRTNTIISLRAINRAYQCAVFLANVSVIQKIMEIAVNIYNSFKDIDLSMLDEVWSPNLMDCSRKASVADAEKSTDLNPLNMSNSVSWLEPPIQKNAILLPSLLPRNRSNSKQYPYLLTVPTPSNTNLTTSETSTTVRVYTCDDGFNDDVKPTTPSKGSCQLQSIKHNLEDVFGTGRSSPITAVEVVSHDYEEVTIGYQDDEDVGGWITESEYEEDV